MWANAQRDGRLAEYRWRPLFNAAKFGWRPLLQCCAVTLPRRETRWNLLGCPKLANRSQPLVGQSSPHKMLNQNKKSKCTKIKPKPKPTKELLVCVCVSLCTIVVHNTAQNSSHNFLSYPPDNHHTDDVYWRGEGEWLQKIRPVTPKKWVCVCLITTVKTSS